MAYASNTHEGLVRPYNEDFVAVVPDLKKSALSGGTYQCKKVSYFGLFDGHGGNGCASFLRDNLHVILTQQESFPMSPETALKQAFKQAEDEFMRQNLVKIRERSGSCGIVVLVVDDTVYLANVGDSRAILSQ
jgi:protein phosphatase 2C family protein 2/3